MATVYSLVCWGGRTGKVITLSIASPCVVTSSNHGLRDGTPLVLSTTGALPTGLVAGTVYYSKSTGLNTFNLYTDAALTSIVNTSGSQSGTQTAKSKKMIDYLASPPTSARWGASGSERCYDSISAWNTARASASSLDEEVCELGQAFDSWETNGININVPAAFMRVTSRINGLRSEAFHKGVINSGFVVKRSRSSSAAIIYTTTWPIELDGFTVAWSGGGVYGVTGINFTQPQCVAYNMVSIGENSTGETGFSFGAAFTKAINCLAYMQGGGGFDFGQYSQGIFLANCIAAKCSGKGFVSGYTSSVYGFYYNNLSIGNAGGGWSTQPSGINKAQNNASDDGTAWYTGADSRVTVATTDFLNYASNDFSPALATSPQVDTGVSYYAITTSDIRDAEVPNYNNGGSEGVDIGCYEFDHGYGNHPAVANISISGIISGSRVRITRDDTTAILYNDVPGTSLTLPTTYIGQFTVVIRKASESPYYREFSAGGTTAANQTTLIKALQQLDE